MAICIRCPFLSHLNFVKPLMYFPKIHWCQKKWHFRKNPQLRTSLFRHRVIIFAKPLINSCQIRHFQVAILVKIANHQKAIFADLWWILTKFAKFATFVIFIKPTLIDMPVLSSCFDFYQTVYKFLPNLSFL